ncbi:MAG: prohibitin family protein [Oscillospiraceae bacterium]|nr:prohibitin family protein [Oscillospiraceae bacterium]
MANNNSNVVNVGGGSVRKIVTAVVILLIAAVVVMNSFTTVRAGHSGVVTTFGKVSETVLAEGLHFKIPFIQDIILIDNRVKKAEANCTAASKDLQTVSSTIAVNYKVLNSYSARVYKDIGMDYEAVIITPSIQECVKAVTAKFTAEELITNRQAIGDQMMELLKDKISTYGIEIQIFNITAFDFTDEYNAAIEAKQTAQQNALKAEQDLQRIKVEAEQKIAQAQAEAEAYRLKSEQITPEILISNYIEKWDGKLPTVVSGDSGTMMIDLSELLKGIGTSSTSGSTSAYHQTAPATPTVTDQSNDIED